jgi:hypothetical protein
MTLAPLRNASPLVVWCAGRWFFSDALLIAGLFTLLPGRIMHGVIFGG